MNGIFILTLAVEFLNSAPVAVVEEWPLRIDAEPEWKVECTGDGIQFFMLTRSEGEQAPLMFSRWPAPGGKDQIPALIKQMADSFLLKVKRNEVPLVSKDGYQVEKIAGDEFSGQAAIFKINYGIYQTIFIVSDGDGICNGQFSGSKTMWLKAKAILKKPQRAD
jgi:hypothetical protein